MPRLNHRYCEAFGEKVLTDRDRLKLMEMSDNHVEHHTVRFKKKKKRKYTLRPAGINMPYLL